MMLALHAETWPQDAAWQVRQGSHEAQPTRKIQRLQSQQTDWASRPSELPALTSNSLDLQDRCAHGLWTGPTLAMHRYCSTDPKIVALSIVPAGIRAPEASSTERLFNLLRGDQPCRSRAMVRASL